MGSRHGTFASPGSSSLVWIWPHQGKMENVAVATIGTTTHIIVGVSELCPGLEVGWLYLQLVSFSPLWCTNLHIHLNLFRAQGFLCIICKRIPGWNSNLRNVGNE